MYIISRCLLGEACRYDGKNNQNEKVLEIAAGKNYIGVCPECRGGLPTPRPPSEIVNDGSGRVVSCEGKDVTAEFELGAKLCYSEALQRAEELGEEIEGAILKAKSPSCGSGYIYDGNFSRTLIPGDGCFAGLLKEKNIRVISEKELEDDKF